MAQNVIEDYDLFEKSARCDNRCFFCCMVGSVDPVDLVQEGTYSRGRKLLFCSGEPLNLKDVSALVRSLKKKWKKVSVCTNAKKLSDRRFAREFMKCGVDEIFATLNGHNALIHDSITRVHGSFAKTVQGLRNALELSKKPRQVDILTVCMLTKSNLPFLYEYLRAARDLGVRTVCFNSIFPFGGGVKVFKKAPSYQEIVSSFAALKEKCAKDVDMKQMKVFLVDVPFCLTQSLAPHGCVFLLNQTSEFKDRATIRRFRYVCKTCVLNYACMGIFKEYACVYGIKEFCPIREDSTVYRQFKKANNRK